MTRLLLGLIVLSSVDGSAGAECSHVSDWPLWQAYVEHFVSPEGRVIDYTGGEVTTSEGQSYALFFSLVANDRPLFRRLYAWTRDNLAGGRLDDRLPAYRWGRRDDRSWGILDRNSAADSDLWIGYTLIEAGRLWSDHALTRAGRALIGRVVEHEVADLPGLGAMLLPAPRGFVHGRLWRLNPSYLPPQLLRGLKADGVPGPWDELRANLQRMIAARARHGFIDDWVGYEPGSGFIADGATGSIGSYDAIRVYLWHALAGGDSATAQLLDGPYQYWRAHGRVPERIDTQQPSPEARPGPVGFLAVLLPRAAQSGDAALRTQLEQQIEVARDGRLYGKPPTYYDQNLVLFAQGAVEGRYRFGRNGRLVPAWTRACRDSHSSATLSSRPP